MVDYLPLYDDGDEINLTASADVTGGRVVEITGPNQVAHAAAGSKKFIGVAAFDAKSGDLVTVFRGMVQRPVASGAINPGDSLVCAADGKVATSATPAVDAYVGTALTAAADGATVEAAFTR